MIANLRWTIVLAALFGAMFGSTFSANPLLSAYDAVYPVVDMRGEINKIGGGEVIIHVVGVKNRDCKYIGIQAFTRFAGVLVDANKERISMPETGATKPTGRFDIGLWRIWPVSSLNDAVFLYVQHDCDGRRVVTKIAEVPL